MARFEILDSTMAPLGEGPAAGDVLFELGMMYSIGRDVPVDLVAAHKWFNLAATKGSADAIRLRREVAGQMSDAEIAAAQRAARDWLRSNEMPAVPAMVAAAAAMPALAGNTALKQITNPDACRIGAWSHPKNRNPLFGIMLLKSARRVCAPRTDTCRQMSPVVRFRIRASDRDRRKRRNALCA